VLMGPSDIVGEVGEVRRDGQVFVRGELWRAHSDEPLAPGDRVEVERLEEGLVLGVRQLPEG
jgi:membrane-bound serine protease (ClpP class)